MKAIQLKPDLPQDAGLRSNREPLYKRLPSRDEDGRLLCDFMMLMPGLRNLPAAQFETRLTLLHALLDGHDDVVFADLNTPLNLLWVSVRTRHGVITQVSAEIRSQFPEAKLVGHTVAERPPRSSGNQHKLKQLGSRISNLLSR